MFRVFWRSIRDVFDDMFLLIITNIVWCLISLPLLAAAVYVALQNAPLPATVLALLSVLPLGPATAGLYAIAQRTTEGRTSKIGQFFEGMRDNARLSWKVYGLWMLGLVTILFNLVFYANLGAPFGAFLQILFLYLLLIWFTFLIYIGPLMLLQTDKRIRVIARNAVLMALGRPLFTLVTLVLMVAIFILSLLPGVLIVPGLIVFALLAVWSFRATNKLIEDADERRRLAAEKAALAAGGPVYSSDKGRGGQIKPRK